MFIYLLQPQITVLVCRLFVILHWFIFIFSVLLIVKDFPNSPQMNTHTCIASEKGHILVL